MTACKASTPVRGAWVASWQELVQHVRTRYRIVVDERDHCEFVARAGTRRQVVHIWRDGSDEGPSDWVHIESPFGRIGVHDLEAVLRRAGDTFGGVTVLGNQLMIRHTLSMSAELAAEIDLPVGRIVAEASRFFYMYQEGPWKAVDDGPAQ
jgi:hypothetical protein